MSSPRPTRHGRPTRTPAGTAPADAGPGELGPDGRRRRTVEGLGTPALALGLVGAGTAATAGIWGGVSGLAWAGIGLGVVAVVLGFVGARRAFHDPRRTGGAALAGLGLGLVGVVVGAVVVVPGLLGIGTFGEGLTLDECMAQAVGQQEQRICVSQHLEEYRARYPGAQAI